MPTIQADISMISATISDPKAAPATRRLPRAAGWMLTALAAGALWYGVFEAIRLAL